MQKQYLMGGVFLLLIAGIVGTWAMSREGSPSQEESAEAMAAMQQTLASTTTASSTAPASMHSSQQLFAQSPDAASAHELYPTPSADATTTLGAFTYQVTDLGGGMHAVTIQDSAAGYAPQSVTVSDGQSVYFIERSSHDDTSDADAFARDDYLVAVDASGYILQ